MNKVIYVVGKYIKYLNCPTGKYVVTASYTSDLQEAKLFDNKHLEEIKEALDHHYSGTTKYQVRDVKLVLQ
jgi:hypothetical protein